MGSRPDLKCVGQFSYFERYNKLKTQTKLYFESPTYHNLGRHKLDKKEYTKVLHKGKYHCIVGLQFEWIGFCKTRKYFVL